MLKGIGIKLIAEIMLMMMMTLVITASITGGALGETLWEGFNTISNSTESTLKINGETELEAKYMLSNASKFVYDRAKEQGCSENQGVDQQNDGNGYGPAGYPALTDTHIGRYPDCSGGGASITRGPIDAAGNSGEDMEGIYSRVSFKITEDTEILLDTTKDEVWIETRLAGLKQGNYREQTLEECTGSIGGASNDFINQDGRFTAFYTRESDNRGNKWLNQHSSDYEGNTYCRNTVEFRGPLAEFGGANSFYEGNVKMQLCPGDEGYIQMNKGEPQNDGEIEELEGDDNFPHIVITGKGEDCGSLRGVPEGYKLRGNVFFVKMDAGKDYPTFGDRDPGDADMKFGLFDSDDTITSTFQDIEVPSSDSCKVAVSDQDAGGAANDEFGHVSFETGAILSKKGSWPAHWRSDRVISYNFEEKNGEKDASDIYYDLSSSGFEGQQLNFYEGARVTRWNPYLVGSKNGKISEQRMEMHGDTLCVDKNEFSGDYARWLICDPNLPDNLKTVKAGENEYNCTFDGQWEVN